MLHKNSFYPWTSVCDTAFLQLKKEISGTSCSFLSSIFLSTHPHHWCQLNTYVARFSHLIDREGRSIKYILRNFTLREQTYTFWTTRCLQLFMLCNISISIYREQNLCLFSVIKLCYTFLNLLVFYHRIHRLVFSDMHSFSPHLITLFFIKLVKKMQILIVSPAILFQPPVLSLQIKYII